MRILTDAADLLGAPVGKAALWCCHRPLADFDGKMAAELVATGHAAV